MSTSAKQEFLTSFLTTSTFGPGELRSYFLDRDIGVAKATNGMVTAIVHRANGPCPDDVAQLHYHTVTFQMNYVLKGTCRFKFEGKGEFEFQAGDSWTQPPGIRHTLLWFSDDFEVLEIVVPADFETIEVQERTETRQ